jgi:hypothetical protein
MDVTVKKNDNVARGKPYREGTFRVEVNDDPIELSEINSKLSGYKLLELKGLLWDYQDLVARNIRQLGYQRVGDGPSSDRRRASFLQTILHVIRRMWGDRAHRPGTEGSRYNRRNGLTVSKSCFVGAKKKW